MNEIGRPETTDNFTLVQSSPDRDCQYKQPHNLQGQTLDFQWITSRARPSKATHLGCGFGPYGWQSFQKSAIIEVNPMRQRQPCRLINRPVILRNPTCVG